MSKLEQMGKTLMETALNFTHPMFEATYPEWSTVSNIGEELVRMSQQAELNENQQIVLEWLRGLSLFPISAIHLLEAGKNVPDNVKMAYEDFDKQDERQLLAAFAEWVTDEVAE